MKKIKTLLLAIPLIVLMVTPINASTNPSGTQANQSPTVGIDYNQIPKHYDVRVFIDSKDNEVIFPANMGKPFIAEGRTFTPYRIMCENLGAEVNWDEGLRKVTANGNNSVVELFIGNKDYKVNGENRKMDVEPFILEAEGRTYIPARYLTEGLDYKIDFAQDGKVMFICSFTKGQSEAEMKSILKEIVKENKIPEVAVNIKPGSKYEKLTPEQIADIKANIIMKEPDIPMGDPRVFKARDCDDLYTGILDRMTIAPNQSFASDRSLMYRGFAGHHTIPGVLTTFNEDGTVTHRDVKVHTFYGGSSMQLEWGWHPIHMADAYTFETIF